MEMIRILGIGWREDDLTLGAIKQLRAAKKVILRTGRCECAHWLEAEGISFDTFDELYEQCEDFDELIEQTADAVLEAAQTEEVVYCVNDLSDKTAALICRQSIDNVIVIPGVSEGSTLLPFAGEDVRTVSAADADTFMPDVRTAALIREIDSAMLASDIKLKLTEHYPDELDIFVCDAQGRISRMMLCDLDRMEEYDHRMCALIPPVHDLNKLSRYDMRHLEEIMYRLRDFDGCAWDREQTHESLRSYMIEEAYEAVDAIERDDTDDLYEELGDVLFQVIFHSEIARQYGEFEFSDVTTSICKKMLRRHPHVFGEIQMDRIDQIGDLWHEIKKQEKSQSTVSETLKAVAKSMPALMRAAKVCKRAGRHEALANQCCPAGEQQAWADWQSNPCVETLGTLLLSLCNCARILGLDPEQSLRETIEKFISNFENAEKNME